MAGFERAGERQFRVSGALDFTTVPAIADASLSLLDRMPTGASIDLAGVERVDSAGLALVLEWIAIAEAAGHHLSIENIPDKLHALARISEVEEFLRSGA